MFLYRTTVITGNGDLPFPHRSPGKAAGLALLIEFIDFILYIQKRIRISAESSYDLIIATTCQSRDCVARRAHAHCACTVTAQAAARVLHILIVLIAVAHACDE